jgi:hypothetical protein
MDFEVLSPWSEVDAGVPRALLPRLTDLKGKTVGLFAFYKYYGPAIMQRVEEVLKERLPGTKFSHFHQPGQDTNVAGVNGPYPLVDTELIKDERYKEQFMEWVKTVDTVVTGHGD